MMTFWWSRRSSPFCHLRKKRLLGVDPSGRPYPGCQGRGCASGNAGEGGIGVGGRALEIRAFINLAILWRGEKKQKNRMGTISTIGWGMRLNHGLNGPVSEPGRISSSIYSALRLSAENADWGAYKFLVSNVSEALGSAIHSFYLSLGSSFSQAPCICFRDFHFFQAFRPTHTLLPPTLFFWSRKVAFGGKSSSLSLSPSLPGLGSRCQVKTGIVPASQDSMNTTGTMDARLCKRGRGKVRAQ